MRPGARWGQTDAGRREQRKTPKQGRRQTTGAGGRTGCLRSPPFPAFVPQGQTPRWASSRPESCAVRVSPARASAGPESPSHVSRSWNPSVVLAGAGRLR